ncbi:single-stranded DNA-binding protein [Thermomonas sp.]|uniref:single-stranded DNA-binding protein n=1 Tax=Thermomonas sp. TaxID=1971895 RepID=UPI001DA671B0|nr:single-stranded DNA-binding protein [Thermomonas sp.]MBZ0087429.1 single-stranded DNA-binding protein [Thermomonas sp.]MCO5054751.1 single-stranded DNA-binding protein [Thermomonas sp.]HRO64232.1 single-stranded DNA-binding protein [Thermomonas sp.]
MARGVNKVILIGNLGGDPEVRYTQSGAAMTTLSIATTSSRKDRDGNWQEKTEWHRVKVFGKTAETAGKYLTKGGQVYIEGHLEYGSYEKEGVKHFTSDIICDEMQMLGGRGGEGGGYARGGGSQEGGYSRGGGERPQRSAPAPRGESGAAPSKPAEFGNDVPFADDDIPF